jgi:hypothetical protein
LKSNLLGRLKNALKADSSSEASGAETITVDDTGPSKTVGTSDILHDSQEVKGRSPLSGKVYVLELKPFLDVVGVGKGSKLANMLNTFCRNLLERSIGGKGAVASQGDDLFFFRFAGKSDQEGWSQAVEIVNEIGSHFLRDAYKPDEILSDILGAVDPKDAFGPDGILDVGKMRAASARQKARQKGDWEDEKPGDPQWQAFGGKDPDHTLIHEWEVAGRMKRPAGVRVKRQAERRIGGTGPIAGKERRKDRHGRRESDNPKQSVW